MALAATDPQVLARQEKLAAALATQGRAALDAGQVEQALQRASLALNVKPDHAPALALKKTVEGRLDAKQAKLIEILGRAQQALAEERFLSPSGTNAKALLTEALALDPRNVEALSLVQQLPARLLGAARARADRGDLEGAEHEADRALALGADPGAALLKARAELRRGDHAAAAARLDAIDTGGLSGAQARFRHALRGHAHDRAGEPAAAVASWLAAHQAWATAVAPAVATVPHDFDEAIVAARAAEPMRVERAPAALLLGAPGGGAELIATLLRDEPGIALLSERFGPQARSDAFSAIEGRYASPTDSEARVQARRYERALAHLKVPPGRAPIDWLPHWDLRLLPLALQILGDVPLIVAARDLRDALLQWLAHGSAQGWRIADAEAAAEWLARSAAQLEWTVAHAGVPVLVVDPTEALADPAGTRARLLAFLGQAPSTQPVAMLGRGVGGLPNLFERGHHAQYAQALVGAFARLDAATRGT